MAINSRSLHSTLRRFFLQYQELVIVCYLDGAIVPFTKILKEEITLLISPV